MLRLLNIEFFKLRHNKASKVLSIIYFALLILLALIATIKFDIGSAKYGLIDQGIFNFPYIWHVNTYVAGIFKFFLLFIIVSMMANEYNYKTLKQNLIDGLSKREFILSKFYTIIVFALVATIFVFIISLILGLIYSDFNEIGIIFSGLSYIFAFFIKLVGFFSFGLFLGILIKRSAFAVAAMIVWLIVENMIKGYLHWFFKGLKNTDEVINSIIQFFPLEAMANLIKEPITKLNAVKSIVSQIDTSFSKNYEVSFLNIIIVLVWIAIFIYSSFVLLEKRDL